MTETIRGEWVVRDVTPEELEALTRTACPDDENAGPADDADHIDLDAS